MPSRRRTLPLIACIALAVPAFAADTSFDGTYTGERVMTSGEPSACVVKDLVSVTIHGDELTFTNNMVKGYALGFSPQPDGSFGKISADIRGAVVIINGHIGAGVLDADASNPECTWHWHLKKQR